MALGDQLAVPGAAVLLVEGDELTARRHPAGRGVERLLWPLGAVLQHDDMANTDNAPGESVLPGVGVVPPVTLVVNGIARSVPSTTLLSALRQGLGLTGAKPGCGEGVCGSCTVLVDGESVRACQQPVAGLAGRHITTIEGLGSGGHLHPVQQVFVDVGAAQCGYCTPGMVLAVASLLARDPDPDEAAVDEALAGNVCRCGAYPRIRRAVHRAAELTASASAGMPANAPAACRQMTGACPSPRRSGGGRPVRGI